MPVRNHKMETELQLIMEKLAKMPAEKQREVLDFLETLEEPTALADVGPPPPSAKPIWKIVEEVTREVPLEAWAELPTDGSINVDFYLYGAPKR
jgi:hypothetical protein